MILQHDFPFPHWDLMLEAGDVLRTWRLLSEPAPHVIIAAEALSDHRRRYLDYEGPVGGGRGVVARWDQGTHETLERPGRCVSTLRSSRLGCGRMTISSVDDGATSTFQFVTGTKDDMDH